MTAFGDALAKATGCQFGVPQVNLGMQYMGGKARK